MFELPPPVMSLTGLNHRFGDKQVLHDCALDLYPGECLAIVGASGSGKSTLLSVLAGRMALPEGARLCLDGQDITPQMTRSTVAYVAQNAATQLDMRLSAASNIARSLLDLGQRHAGDILQACEDWLDRLGIDPSRAAERVGRFSGGMQQRVQIAAALVHEPAVLLLDEPTTGLDTVAQAEFLDVLRALKRDLGVAMLLITHDLAVARLVADRVLVLDAGRFVEDVVFDRLLAAPQSPAAVELVRAMP